MRDDVSLYETIIAGQSLKGYEPNVFVVDKKGDIYLSIKDAANILELSPGRLRGLVPEKRLDAIQPGGRDLFISLSSILQYLEERKTPGRPPKSSNE